MAKIRWAFILCVGAIALAPLAAHAQERLIDGAGGAVAGVIVGGPIGALAGGIIGVAAGPNIARGLGLKGHRHHHHQIHHRD